MTAIEFDRKLISLENPLKYFAIKLTSDIEDAEDLLQETFLKALKYKDKFEEQTNLKSWLYTIMKNTFINNYRRNARKNKLMVRGEDAAYGKRSKAALAIAPDSVYNHKEILVALSKLGEELRVPFNMHQEGYKYKEIAKELDLPIGTIKSRIFIARQKLGEELQDYVN